MIALMLEAARTSETSVDNYFTRQYIPEDKSELRSGMVIGFCCRTVLRGVSRLVNAPVDGVRLCL
jgi:hypothetical protein